jgi:hypothetical protein
MKKYRITDDIIRVSLYVGYGTPRETDTITFTPIIYNVPYCGYEKVEGKFIPRKCILHQKRIIIRASCLHFMRFTGKAPIGKVFTLEEFKKHFYAIRGEGCHYIFRYYK